MEPSKLLLSFFVLVCTFGVLVTDISAGPQVRPATTGNSLQNMQLRLISFGGSGRDTVVSGSTTITLKFGTDGRISGSGGCNSYSGRYTQQGDLLSFRQIISTKRACVEEGTNQQEQVFFSSLEAARRFKLFGDRLTIFLSDGRRSLNFGTDILSNPKKQRYENLSSPVDLLASFYNAVNNQDYERAYRYWETPPVGFQQFSSGYRDAVSAQLIVQPPTTVEGAAGSLYVEIPTVIVAVQRDGSERVFVGCYVARKSNVGRADKVWRIYKANVAPAPIDAIAVLLAQACRN